MRSSGPSNNQRIQPNQKLDRCCATGAGARDRSASLRRGEGPELAEAGWLRGTDDSWVTIK